MSFTWKDFLDCAKFLSGQGVANPQEAALRTSTSRAYFAAYGHATRYAIYNLKFIPSVGVEEHSKLRIHFKKEKMTGIQGRLDRLRQWRNDCDYKEVVNKDLKKLAEEAIKTSQKVFDELLVEY